MNFKPGEVVVCIGLDSPCCGETTLRAPGLPQPILRKIYRVDHVGNAQCNACGEVMPCFVPVGYRDTEWAWPQVMFKRLERANKDIFRLAKVRV